MLTRIFLLLILPLVSLAGCSVESRLNRQYVASVQILDKLQPVRDIKPAARECEVCHKLFDMRSQRKIQRYYPIRISHKQHAALGIDCLFCHRKAAGSAVAADYLMPDAHADAEAPDAYAAQPQAADANPCKACHIHYSAFEKNDPRIPARCETCHLFYQEGKSPPYIQLSLSGLINNHKAHSDAGVTCLRCHAGFNLMKTTTLRFIPRMDICNECHKVAGSELKSRKGSIDEMNADATRRAVRLYSVNCAPCHGQAGRGDGPVAAFFKADLKPRDHTDREYIGKKTDQQLFDVIWKGGAEVNRSLRMPAFEGLISEEEARMMVQYIRGLSGTESTGQK